MGFDVGINEEKLRRKGMRGDTDGEETWAMRNRICREKLKLVNSYLG